MDPSTNQPTGRLSLEPSSVEILGRMVSSVVMNFFIYFIYNTVYYSRYVYLMFFTNTLLLSDFPCNS